MTPQVSPPLNPDAAIPTAAQRFIVAEISKNWKGHHGVYEPYTDSPMLNTQFENIIARNLSRGYRLHSFQFQRFMLAVDEMNETLIAVFELIEGRPTVRGAERRYKEHDE